jgi:hypothetical protein
MVGGDGGSISAWGEDPEFAPTCQRCLSLMDRMFPPPSLHPRLPIVARVGADVVAEHGYAEVCGVPGDQQAELRRQIRSLVRAATGHPCRTYVRGSTVFVVCEPIAELHYDEELSAAADAVEAVLFGKAPRPRAEPEWRIMWSTSATD